MKKTPKKTSPWPIGDLVERMNNVKNEIERIQELARIAEEERSRQYDKLYYFARWGFEDEETIAEFEKGMAEYNEKYRKNFDFSELRKEKLDCIAWMNERYSARELLEKDEFKDLLKTDADKKLASEGRYGDLCVKYRRDCFFWCFSEWKY
jgi:hypothetical protein